MPPKTIKKWPPVAVLNLASQSGLSITVSTVGTVPGSTGNNHRTATTSVLASWQLYWGDGLWSTGVGAPPATLSHDYTTTDLIVYLRLVVVDQNSLSAQATLTVSLPGVVLAAPTGLTATAVSQTQVNLAWVYPTDPNVQFQIQRKTGAGAYATIAVVGAAVRTYGDSGLIAATTYTYQIIAFTNTQTSAGSNQASATTFPASPPPMPPNPPSALTATAISFTQVNLAWTDNSTDESGFLIERQIGAGAFTQIATVGVNVTSYQDLTAVAATSYGYRVRAYNAAGNSAYSNTATATTPTPLPPNAPTVLLATTVSNTQITLSWHDNSTDETGFSLERKIGTGGFGVLQTIAADHTTYLDQGLAPSTLYTYRIRAFNAVGNSAYSNESATATDPDTVPPPPPNAPTNVTATALGPTSIQVSWADGGNNSLSYTIERSLHNANTFIVISSIAAPTTTFTDVGLAQNTAYDYRIKANNNQGSSPYSSTVSATTTNPQPPIAPSSLQATAVSQTQVNLTWTDNSLDETSFELERQTGVSAFVLLVTLAQNVISYQDFSVVANTSYGYRVRARNANGASAYSNTVTVTTPPVPPQPPNAPTLLTATAVDSSSIALAWQDNSNNETGFLIERLINSVFTQIAQVASNVTNYANTGLSPSTSYSYRVRAFNNGGNSAYTNTASATTTPTPPPSTTFPNLWLTVNGQSPTVAEMKAQLAGPQLATFQQYVDTFCATLAHGGMLDTYVSGGFDQRQGVVIYSFLIVTFRVTGIDYRDVTDISQLEAVLFQLWDALMAAGVSQGDDGADVQAVQMGYHWAYNSLSPTRRQTAVDWCQGNPGIPDYGFSTPPYHHVHAKFRLLFHSAGLMWVNDPAINASDLNDAAARIALRSSYYDGSHGNRTATNLFAGTSGGVCDGRDYSFSELSFGIEHIDFLYNEMWRTSRNDTSSWNAGANTTLEYHPLWVAHLLAPYRVVHAGLPFYVLLKTNETADIFPDAVNGPATSETTGVWLANHRRFYQTNNNQMAQLADWLLKALFAPGGLYQFSYGATAAIRFGTLTNFFGYSTLVGGAPNTLGLAKSRLFPSGMISCRSGWNFDGTDTTVDFLAPPYMWTNSGYGPVPTGSFRINRRGPLVIEPGAGAHCGYQELGFGRNTIIFVDPNETGAGRGVWDQGASRFSGSYATPTEPPVNFVPGTQWDIGGFKAGTGVWDLYNDLSTHDYDFAFADCTRAYNGPTTNIYDPTNTSKCEKFERYWIWFRAATPGVTPDRVVIFDRTRTTDPRFEQRWLLHPPGTPARVRTLSLTGSSSSAPGPSRGGSTAGKTTYIQPTLGTVAYGPTEGLTGKMFWTPLQPVNRKVTEVWGPNGAGQFYQSDSHEYEDPYGAQTAGFGSSSGIPEFFEGQGHYELIAQTITQDQNFLNVLEPCESSQGSPTATADLTGTNVTVAQVGNRIAIFKTTSGTLTTGSFVIPSAGTYRALLVGLGAGASVTVTGGTVTLVSNGSSGPFTASAVGTLYVQIVTAAPSVTVSIS